jgi:predicted nucleic acid-binding protein
MSRPLTDFSGDALYLDTMIPYALLRGIDPAAQTLFTRIQAGEFLAYTSVLTFDELTYRLAAQESVRLRITRLAEIG